MSKVSIVVPVYNEEANIKPLYSEFAESISEEFELIFIDDGSTDGSLGKIKSIDDPRVRFVSFSKNFGHQSALKAGFEFASGDCVITLDADLQHPVSLVSKMIEEWKSGHQVVYTKRVDKSSLGILKKITSKSFYFVFNAFCEQNIESGTADFRLLDRKVVNIIKDLSENDLFFRGLVPWVGFKQKCLEYEAKKRAHGKSSYTIKKMIQLAVSGITSNSTRPLYLSFFLGAFFSLCAFLYGTYALYIAFFTDRAVSGWPSLIMSVLFIGGIQLISTGVLGLYIGKVYHQTRMRPQYIVADSNVK